MGRVLVSASKNLWEVDEWCRAWMSVGNLQIWIKCYFVSEDPPTVNLNFRQNILDSSDVLNLLITLLLSTWIRNAKR